MKVIIEVVGVPQPQGNKTVYNGHVVEGRRPAAREAFKSWREAIIEQARTAAGIQGTFADGPLELTITFWMPKPASAKKAELWCWKKPDIDKLERAVLDALTQSGLIVDDSRVVRVVHEKPYAIGRPPGVQVAIEPKETPPCPT